MLLRTRLLIIVAHIFTFLSAVLLDVWSLEVQKRTERLPLFYQTSRKSLARGAENNFAGKSNNWVLGRSFFLHLSSNRCSMGLEKKSPGPYLAPSVCFKYVARF